MIIIMKRHRNTTQMKAQAKDTEVQINEEEIDKLPEKEFRIMITEMIKIPWRKMEKMQESINKDLELKNKHAETNNTITEIKNTLEGINSRISEAEEWFSELEDKMVEITSEEQNKVKRMKRTEDSLRDLWDNIRHTKIWIIGVPEEEKKKGYEKIFEQSYRTAYHCYTTPTFAFVHVFLSRPGILSPSYSKPDQL